MGGVDPRRAHPRHALPLRPARRRCRRSSCGCGRRRTAARRSCRTRMRVDADGALRQLAAGSAEQLRRAADVSRAGPRAAHRGRPRRRDGGLQPVRLLPRAARRARLRSPTTTGSCSELQPFLRTRAADAALRRLPRRRSRASRAPHDRLPGRAEPAAAAATSATSSASSPACRRRRRRSTLAQRVVPRLDLAARAAAAPSRARGALRVRLPDSARRPTSSALDGPSGPGAATSPTSTPGARSTCPAPAGSGSTRRRACSPAKGTSRSPARPSRRAPRRVTGARRRVRGRVRARDVGRSASTSRRASPSRTPTRSGHAIVALGDARRRATSRARDVRLTMGGEPTFVSVDDRDGAEWNTDGARADQAAAAPPICSGGCGGTTAPTASCTSARASGIRASSCRAGRSAATGARTASRPGATPSLFADERRDYGVRPRRRGALPARAGRDARRAPTRTCRPATRTSGTTCGASGGCRSTSTRSTRASTTSSSATGCGASSPQGLDAVVGYALPLAPRPTASGALAHRARGILRGERHVPDARRLADGLSPAARFAAVGQRGRLSRTCASTIRWTPRPPLPARCEPRCAPRGAATARQRPRRPSRADRARARARSSRPPGSCAPRSAPRRATACSTSSCRRSPTLEDYLELVAAVEATAADARHAGAARRLPAAVAIRGCAHFQITPDPGRDRGQRSSPPAAGTSSSSRRRRSTRRRAQARLTTEKFMLDGRHTGTGGGNHFVLGGADAGRQPVPAAAGSAAQPASPTGTTTRRCRTCSPACSSARRARRRASTKRATTASTSSRSRSRRSRPRRAPRAAVARRPRCSATCSSTSPATRTAPSSASTSCTRPTRASRPPRPPRAARVRDAAARAHEPGAAAAAARARRALLARAVRRRALDALGHRAARPLHAAVLRLARLRGRARRTARARAIALDAGVVRAALRVPLPAGTATSRRAAVQLTLRQALEPWHVLGEEGAAGGTVALRRLVGRAPAGAASRGLTPRPLRRHLQRPARCRCSRPGATASTSPACATARGSRRRRCTRRFRCTRRSPSTSSTPGWSARSAAASIT